MPFLFQPTQSLRRFLSSACTPPRVPESLPSGIHLPLQSKRRPICALKHSPGTRPHCGLQMSFLTWFNDQLIPFRKPFITSLLLSPWARHGACCRMAGNSTGDAHVPGSQLSVTDIIVISVYFALNVAVGIWVRTCSGPLGSRA